MKTSLMTIIMILLFTVSAPAQDAGAPPTAPAAGKSSGVQGFVYDSKGVRDPFLRLVDEHGTIYNYDQDMGKSDMVLEGILVGGNQNIAIINSDIVVTGDMVGTYIVEGITTDTVILRKGQDEIHLKLNREE